MRNRVIIKAEARRKIQQGHVSPILATAVVMVLCFLLDRAVDLVEGGSLFASYQYNWAYYQAVASGDIDSIYAVLNLVPQPTIVSTALSIAVMLFTVVLNGGYYLFCLDILHSRETPLSVLMDGLGSTGRLIWCNILVSIKIALWSMLFVIPGIIAAYRYRFAIYNVLCDSSLSASQAIALSCEQTRGIKGELFMLDLSFIGWNLLSTLTLGLLNLWVSPYMVLCDLSYFEDARQRLGGGSWNGQGWNGGQDWM